MRVWIFILALLPTPVLAEDYAIDAHLIDRCLGINQDTPMACVGVQADLCFEHFGGGADMVLSGCQVAETAYWDEALNAAYQDLLRLTGAKQSSEAGYEPNQLTDAAREMQRSWIAYRDATCWLEIATAFPTGYAAGSAANGCQMRETARQYFQLQEITGGYRQ